MQKKFKFSFHMSKKNWKKKFSEFFYRIKNYYKILQKNSIFSHVTKQIVKKYLEKNDKKKLILKKNLWKKKNFEKKKLNKNFENK